MLSDVSDSVFWNTSAAINASALFLFTCMFGTSQLSSRGFIPSLRHFIACLIDSTVSGGDFVHMGDLKCSAVSWRSPTVSLSLFTPSTNFATVPISVVAVPRSAEAL